MNNAFFRRLIGRTAITAALLVFTSICSAQYVGTNGIFAEFNTSMGSYTCVLYYAESPKAVANFIGLATGQRAWLDLRSGVVKTNPFYNGITFHRVVTNFVNQFGSPNGQGNDGPGYAFVDEFTNSLRFDSFGVLAVANSGPDSNGSQYFITVTNTPGLNDVHTIVGQLYGGSNVIYAINRVATLNEKPLTNVFINSVKIQRSGAAAIAFDINAQGLPLVTNLNLKIARTGANVSLTFSNRLYADNRLYSSGNLASWTANQLGIETALPVNNTNLQSAAASAQFFRAAQIQYPGSTLAPKAVYARTVTLNFSGGLGTFLVGFDNEGGGSYFWSGGFSGPLIFYNWFQEPYRARLSPLWLVGFQPMILRLDYETPNAGTFVGTIGANNFFGTFVFSP